MPHDPAKLTTASRYPRQGGRGQRRWNVWYLRLKCPQCGREFVRLQNPLRGRRVRCIGSDRLRIEKE